MDESQAIADTETAASDKILVLLTDGKPTVDERSGVDQSPCTTEIISKISTLGEDVMVIGIGDEALTNIANVSCIAKQQTRPYTIELADFYSFSQVIYDFARVLCPEGDSTPFDGSYEQMNLQNNDIFRCKNPSWTRQRVSHH